MQIFSESKIKRKEIFTDLLFSFFDDECKKYVHTNVFPYSDALSNTKILQKYAEITSQSDLWTENQIWIY